MDLFTKKIAESINQFIPFIERIEVALRAGWAVEQALNNKSFTVKKEKEPNAEVNVTYTQPNHNCTLIHIAGGQQAGGTHQSFGCQGYRR